MDPQEACDAFAAAADHVVQTSSGQAFFSKFNVDQIAEVKQQMRPSDVLLLAKQYFKAIETVRELQRRLSVFPNAMSSALVKTAVPLNSPATEAKPYNSGRARCEGAAVPYVKVAPPSMASLARRHEYGSSFYDFNFAIKRVANSPIGKAYIKFAKLALFLLAISPLIVLCVFMTHLCMTLVYLAFHPELLVTAFFKMIWGAPSLTDYFAKRIWNQISTEIGGWFS